MNRNNSFYPYGKGMLCTPAPGAPLCAPAGRQPYVPQSPQLCAPQQIQQQYWPQAQQLCAPQGQPQQQAPVQNQAAAQPGQIVAEAKPETRKWVKHSKKTTDFTAKLTRTELENIIAMYGVDIQDIYELAPGQKWMFSEAEVVTSTFFTQTMFKAIASIKPSAFRLNTDKVVAKHDNLRTAFAHTGLKQPYQVVLNSRQAEIIFQDISDTAEDELDEKLKSLMEADRRRGFDLEKDVLLRISIYRTPDIDGKEACAVIVSQPHINIDGASSSILYKELFLDYVMHENGEEVTEDPAVAFKNYIDYITTVDKTKEFDYWKTYLADLPGLRPVPGYKKSSRDSVQANSALEFDLDMTKKIRSLQRSYKATLNNIIQSAWGVMLQSIFGEKDVVFGAITSGRSAEVAGSAMIMGGMVNALPVRVKAEVEESFKDVVKKMQTGFVESMSNSHCSPFEIQAELGRKEPIFDHLLNFHNFAGAEAFSQGPVVEGITMIGTESFDNLASDLCVYFGNVMGLFNAKFTYNANTFTSRKIELLKKNLAETLRQICENPEIKVGEIQTDGMEAFAAAEKDAQAAKQEMASFLKEIKIFSGLDESVLENMAEFVQEETYVEDDIIARDKKELRKVSFVRQGFVELSRANIHGWYLPVKIYKAGDLITPEAMIGIQKLHGNLITASANASIVSIDMEIMDQFIEKYPSISKKVGETIYSQLRSMTAMWLNAD